MLRYPPTQGHQLQEEKVRTQWRSQAQEEDKGLIMYCLLIYLLANLSCISIKLKLLK